MPITQLITIMLDDGSSNNTVSKPITINLKSGSPRRPAAPVEDTKIEQLRWEPTIEVSRWSLMSEATKTDCLNLTKGSDVEKELQAILERSIEDQVLVASYAYDSDASTIIGFCLINAWISQTTHQGALLLWVAPGWSNNKVESLLGESLLQEVTGYDYIPTIEKGMEVHCQKQYGFLKDLCLKYDLTYKGTF